MQADTKKQWSSFLKIFLGIFLLLAIGATQSITFKKAFLYDDTVTETVIDIDTESDDNKLSISFLDLYLPSYTVVAGISQLSKPNTFCSQHKLVARSGKLYLLFHQLKLDIA